MLTTLDLLDAAKLAQGIRSEYRLARVLGVSDNGLYNYRHGRTPDDERALRLAMLAGLNVPYVLTCMAAERSKDADTKSALTKAARDLADLLSGPGGNTPPGSSGPGNLPTPSQGSESPANPDGYGARAVADTGSPFYTSWQVSPALPLSGAVPLGLLGAIVSRRRLLSART